MDLTRRSFVTVAGGLLVGLGMAGCSHPASAASGPPSAAKGRRLVVIYLGGGNDGLNTIAPYGEGAYYDARPNLAIKESEALPLAGKLGLHPNLRGLKKLWDAGKLTVIQGVGYPNPDRSHFRSFDIWATAQVQGVSPVGWLGRYLDLSYRTGEDPLRAITVGSAVNKSLVGAKGTAVAIESLDRFQIRGAESARTAIEAMYGGSGNLTVVRGKGQTAINAAHAVQHLGAAYAPAVEYPKQNKLAPNLQLIVKLLAGGAESQLFQTTLGGFDDHADLKAGHDALLKQVDEALWAYQQDLEAHGLGDQVVTLVYSEFGRRVKENLSGGTDHGAAAPAFLIGGPVKGGLVGDHPSLTQLVDGDLQMSIDFRSLYTTLIEAWLGGPSASEVLGGRFEALPLLG